MTDDQSKLREEIKTVNAIEVVKRHFDAWNRHDADAIVALFAEGGTYSNPMAGQGLTGQAISGFAQGVFTAFPDASFEIVSIGDTGGGLVATQWLARGANTGQSADGSPPTGRPVTLPGASFTEVEGDKIRSGKDAMQTWNITPAPEATPSPTASPSSQ